MNNFIKKIIKDNESKEIDFRYENYESIFIKEKYNTYYLFMFLDKEKNLNEMLENTHKIADTIKKADVNNLDADKNVTCVFCLHATDDQYYQSQDTNSISDLSKEICAIEEDLNYFKKNVLLYTNDMLEFVNKNELDFKTLCKQYFTKENFEKFKNDPNENYQYDLLSNIFIKVPFLNYYEFQKNEDEISFNNLDVFIESQLNQKELDKVYINNLLDKIEKMDTDEKMYDWLDELILEDDTAMKEKG